MGFFDQLQSIIPLVLFYSAPLIFTALGGVFSERAGVVNIGLEGLMVMGAFVGIVFNLAYADVFGSLTPYLSILAAMIVSALFSIIHAIASVSLRANQVVSGVAINFLALGVGVFLTKQWYGKGQTDVVSQPFYSSNIRFLEDIPFIGEMFFQGVYKISYVAIILAFIAWFVLIKPDLDYNCVRLGNIRWLQIQTELMYIKCVISPLLSQAHLAELVDPYLP